MDFQSFSWCIGACRSTYLHQNPEFTKFTQPYHSQWYSEQYYLGQTSCIYYICGKKLVAEMQSRMRQSAEPIIHIRVVPKRFDAFFDGIYCFMLGQLTWHITG